MRVTLGLTGLVAATAMATAIIRPPAPAAVAAPDPTVGPPDPTTPPPAPVVVRHVTQYVQLKPGETAPPGAKVVKKAAPSPRVIVVTITPPPTPIPVVQPAAPAPRRVVVVTTTRQSGQP
jgi:hypothetical protein